MVLYTCGKCLKTFNKKSNYIIHIEHRKNPCVSNSENITQFTLSSKKTAQFTLQAEKPALFALSAKNKPQVLEEQIKIIDETKTKISCEHCAKYFTRKASLIRHYNTCTVHKNIIEQLKVENEKLKNEQRIKEEENEKLKNEQRIKDEENEKLKNEQRIKDEENEKLKIENEKLNNTIINKPAIINNGTINNNNNNNININIVNYGEEDLSKLDLKKILKYDNSFIEMVFRDIHCNAEIPENQNILLPSLTRYDIYVKLNNEWLKRNKKEILTERYTTIRGHIMDLYDKESEVNKGKADNTYFHFLKQIKLVDPSNNIYKPQEEKKIIDGMANVLYNHKHNIKSIIKTPLIKNKIINCKKI